jgi:hypothetical protein
MCWTGVGSQSLTTQIPGARGQPNPFEHPSVDVLRTIAAFIDIYASSRYPIDIALNDHAQSRRILCIPGSVEVFVISS